MWVLPAVGICPNIITGRNNLYFFTSITLYLINLKIIPVQAKPAGYVLQWSPGAATQVCTG
ncbi:hypothetical protein HYN43_003935 [Mucilaginibacter celer]|uniref:Uncharacterized protein n=1 Tax=Mucilaginibacter celer TaxID=2305508 RepID=A0A494VLN8_9SPHI|nr:hypothetical protein HYN43_003935 [Mucilaginibacter celer]